MNVKTTYEPSDREQVMRETARVRNRMRQLAIADIRHTEQYERTLQSLGWTSLQRWFPNFLFVTPIGVLRGAKP